MCLQSQCSIVVHQHRVVMNLQLMDVQKYQPNTQLGLTYTNTSTNTHTHIQIHTLG